MGKGDGESPSLDLEGQLPSGSGLSPADRVSGFVHGKRPALPISRGSIWSGGSPGGARPSGPQLGLATPTPLVDSVMKDVQGSLKVSNTPPVLLDSATCPPVLGEGSGSGVNTAIWSGNSLGGGSNPNNSKRSKGSKKSKKSKHSNLSGGRKSAFFPLGASSC